ncbi:MAG: hypothetical protein KGN02_06515 [bacterium]|nr:hypothetical protein [bacterium]
MLTICRVPLHGHWRCRRPNVPHYHRLAGRALGSAHARLHQALAALFAAHRLQPFGLHSSWTRR